MCSSLPHSWACFQEDAAHEEDENGAKGSAVKRMVSAARKKVKTKQPVMVLSV